MQTTKKLIYIAHPIGGDVENNIKKVKQILKNLIDTMDANKYTFVAPYLSYLEILDDSKPEDRKKGMMMSNHVLEKCDEMWIFGDVISKGIQEEIEHANEHNVKIQFRKYPVGL